MNILSFSSFDIGGGAEKLARDLNRGFRSEGQNCWLAVGRKRDSNSDTIEIPRSHPPRVWARLCWKLYNLLEDPPKKRSFNYSIRQFLWVFAQGIPGIERALGYEDFYYPGNRKLLKILPGKPDMIHAHNLHGYYFDLRWLPELSNSYPLVLTLHDEWMLTGHCAYTMGCDRWEQGCGHCPDLNIFPAINMDRTAFNWKRKKSIIQKSRPYIATSSHWLMERVERSMLKPIETRVIYDGVDLAIFHPIENPIQIKTDLGLPTNAIILFYLAVSAKKNPFKDYATIRESFKFLNSLLPAEQCVTLVTLGGDNEEIEDQGRFKIYHFPFQNDPELVARFYQVSDIFLHAANSDNFPTTILEAMACGLPVIATAVGGIPEQVRPGETGFLVPPRDSKAMSLRTAELILNDDMRKRMSGLAIKLATEKFSLDKFVSGYLDWFQEILEIRNR